MMNRICSAPNQVHPVNPVKKIPPNDEAVPAEGRVAADFS